MKTIAMLDGSIRTVELGTLEEIELCRDIAKQSDHDITGEKLPYRIPRRMRTCRSIGLSVVKALTANSDVIAVEVSDGTRTMAQWRLMENGLGYTGTHQSHPLTPRKITFNGERWQ